MIMRHIFTITDGSRLLRRVLCGLALVSAALTSCVRDEIQAPADLVRAGELRMAFSVDDMDIATRAVATDPHERKVSDVHILFFDQSGDYITYRHAAVSAGSSYFNISVRGDATGAFPDPQGVLTANTRYRTLVIGNAHEYVPNGYSSFDQYLNQIVMNGSYESVRQDLYATVGSGGGSAVLPMWGEMQDAEGVPCDFSYTGSDATGHTTAGSIRFRRSVCRLDLRNEAAASLIISRVKLVNFRKGGYYFHQDVAWAPASGSELGGINDGTWIDVAAPGTPGGSGQNPVQEVKGQIYAFPNMVPAVAQNDQVTTYLMIEGYYQDGTDNTPENPRNKKTYYRFNMAQNGQSQILRRNHVYRGVIVYASAPGSETETGAEDATVPQLTYSIGETWEETGNSTVTDANGNFLIVSRAMMTFSSDVGSDETVKVQVKEGLSWAVEWVDESGGGDHGYFEYSRIDDGSFSVRTKGDNKTEFVRRARLKVTASGGSVSPTAPLVAFIDVVQFSSNNDSSVLLVNNQSGSIEQSVPGEGGTVRLYVQTGSQKSMWKVEDVANSASSVGISWTVLGANNGTLEVSAPANISISERKFSLKVRRMKDGTQYDNSVDPVIIEFTQPVSSYLLTVSPSVSMDSRGLVLNGFDEKLGGVPNGISKQYKMIVNLADPTNYTITVESSFRSQMDLYLTKGETPPDATNQYTKAKWDDPNATSKLIGLKNGESFWINVWRTGPGDPDITGTIKITAVPNTGTTGRSQTYPITVTIETPCIIGDVLIDDPTSAGDYILIPDRNVGAVPRIQNGRLVPAKNFINNPKNEIHIAGNPWPDSENYDFRGEYLYRVTDAVSYWLRTDDSRGTNIDNEGTYSPWYKLEEADRWGGFSPDLMKKIVAANEFCWSKDRVFMVSKKRDKTTGKLVGCYWPIAGRSDYQTPLGEYRLGETTSGLLIIRNESGSAHKILTSSSTRSAGYCTRLFRKVTKEEFDAWK